MTTTQTLTLQDTCNHCGEARGAHKFLGRPGADCTWAYDAASSTYDQAERRYFDGLWSADQWEAYTYDHAVSAQYVKEPMTPEVETLHARLWSMVNARKAGTPDWSVAP